MKLLASLAAILVTTGCATAQPPQTQEAASTPIPQDRVTIDPAEARALHKELDAAPERRGKVANSFIPLRDERGKITSYIVHIKGEAEAFARFGLQNGDIVRKINSMPMTEVERWQYIVDEVVAGKTPVLVVEIERGGKPRRLICEFREKDSNHASQTIGAEAAPQSER